MPIMMIIMIMIMIIVVIFMHCQWMTLLRAR